MPVNSGTILLVEDEALIALAEARTLEKEGYAVLRAGSGEEAVEIASSNPGIDLVLMDIDLGLGMDGTEAARRILDTRDVPVLFLSSHVEPEVAARTEAVTSYGYVVKNSGTMVLLASIKMAFRLHESNRRASLSARRFEAVSGTTMEGFWISDSEGRILEVNLAYCRMSGYSREELLGMRIADLEAVMDDAAIRGEILRIRQLGSDRFETRHRAKDGRTIEVEVNATDVPDQGYTICFLRDVTDRKRMEELRREREQYSRILNRMTAEMIDLEDPRDLFRYIVLSMEERYPDTVILFNSIDENEGLARLECVAGLDGDLLRRALGLIGFDPVGRTFRLSATHDGYFRSGRLVPFEGGLAEFCDGQFPEPVARAVEKLIGLHRIHTIGLAKGEVLLGALHFFTFRGSGIEDPEFVEAFVRQAGLILRQKLTEAAVRESESRLRTLSDNLPGGIVYQVDFGSENRERRFTYISGGVEMLHGVSAEAVLADPGSLYGQFPEEERRRISDLEDAALGSMSRFYVEARFRKPDGTERWGLLSSMPRKMPNGHVVWDGIEIDITELKKAEENSARLLREKELVLKEVHHRIKNNLAAVESILRLQADLRTDPESRTILEDAAGRVISMETLYDRLYRAGDFGRLSVREYLESLLPEIMRCHARSEGIRTVLDSGEFELDSRTLSTLGILIYELANNALKHAFEGRMEGTISVSAALEEDRVRIVLADDGIGLPASVSIDTSTGFGMRLVGLLAEQLKGGIRVERDRGTRYILEFPVPAGSG